MALRPQQVTSELLNKVTKALGITALDQWYYVHHKAATKAIGSRALNKYGGTLLTFLQHAYPLHQFDEDKLKSTRIREKDQKFAEVVIRRLFPTVEIHTKARKAVGIVNPETEAYLEIDFWIPSLKLGIEYQDKHHYEYQWYAAEALEEYKKRDDVKKAAMSNMGYTLITIGYWWDKSIESVAATIRQYRPDLLGDYAHTHADPVPTYPPIGYSTAPPVIPGVAGIMSPFIPRINFDPTNWYGGEKYDGVRGLFNPKLNKMFSRSGNDLSVLPSLLNDIPKMLIEGEIMAGRGNYNNTVAISHHTIRAKVDWSKFRYMIFDIPDSGLGNYTQRYSAFLNGVLAHPFIFAQLALRVLLASKSHLKMLADSIIRDGGEGIIAQQDAKYEYGRAKGLAKIKVRRDGDAQVLHVNKLWCTCKLVNGVTTKIVFCDGFNSDNVKIGDIVSFYHEGHSQSGLPKRGEIYKVRYDITWESLIAEKPQCVGAVRSAKDALGIHSLTSYKARNKMGHWHKPESVRAFFNKFAQTARFDPLVADNWYPVRHLSVKQCRGNGFLAYYSVKQALKVGYPELAFEDRRFEGHYKPTGYWRKPSNVRAFFEEFARTACFDPLVADNWYSVGNNALKQAGGSGVLSAHSNKKMKALLFAFSELKFDHNKFRTRIKKR